MEFQPAQPSIVNISAFDIDRDRDAHAPIHADLNQF